MLVKLIRWLLGYVEFVITGKFPERFINVVNKNNLSIFNVHKNGEKLCACMHLRDYKNIRPYARKSRVRLHVTKRNGLPFYIDAHKNRVGVVIGVLIFVLIVSVMSSFVWTIEITGLKTISHSEVLDTLCSKGLYIGTYKGKADFQVIARNTMLEIEDIGWMSINVVGSHASVEIKEKSDPPKIKENKKPANIKAKCDGVIKSIEVLNGEACFEVGSAVIKDQLIVSSVVKDEKGGMSLVRADARVVAQTTHKKQFVLRKDSEVCSFLPYKKRKKLSVFGLYVPVSFVFADDSICSKRYQSENVTLFDTTLPLGISTQFLYEKNTVEKTYSQTEAEIVFKNNSVLFECFNLSDCTVLDSVQKIYENNECYIFEVTYTCLQDIATVSEIDAKNFIIEDYYEPSEKSE